MSDDVKRWDLEADCSVRPYNGSMYEREEGQYVEHAEYAKLESRYAALVQAINEVEAKQWSEICDACKYHEGDKLYESDDWGNVLKQMPNERNNDG